MSDPIDSDLAAHAYRSDLLWKVLEDLVSIGSRLAGSRGERKGMDFLRGVLGDISDRPVHLEEFPIDAWQPKGATIHVGGAEIFGPHRALPLPDSPDVDIERDLVDLWHGRPVDFERAGVEGAIAMVSSHTPEDADRKLHRLCKYVSALGVGADGLVYRNFAERCLPLTREIGWHDTPAATPSIDVSAEVRERLARQCRMGSQRARIRTDHLRE